MFKRKLYNSMAICPLVVFIFGCNGDQTQSDASGTFEATEVIIASEANGRILQLDVREGGLLEKNTVVGQIDPSGITLQKEQASSSVDALQQKTNNAAPQVEVLQAQYKTQQKQIAVQQAQLAVLQKEQIRFSNLVAAQAAPAKQLDDINGQINVLEEQIAASRSQLQVLQSQVAAQQQTVSIQNRSILSENKPLESRVAILQDQLNKTKIINPMKGTVIAKYADANEFTTVGKPLYKIADLSTMQLRAYISGDQLAQVKLMDTVKIIVDDGKKSYRHLIGQICWISDKAEFTPKTIQTKNERANLVYAIKINVPNDGYLKIGMYGEVIFVKK
jgi:HlyD family secretion protein